MKQYFAPTKEKLNLGTWHMLTRTTLANENLSIFV
jgi:hypothetical protein